MHRVVALIILLFVSCAMFAQSSSEEFIAYYKNCAETTMQWAKSARCSPIRHDVSLTMQIIKCKDEGKLKYIQTGDVVELIKSKAIRTSFELCMSKAVFADNLCDIGFESVDCAADWTPDCVPVVKVIYDPTIETISKCFEDAVLKTDGELHVVDPQ